MAAWSVVSGDEIAEILRPMQRRHRRLGPRVSEHNWHPSGQAGSGEVPHHVELATEHLGQQQMDHVAMLVRPDGHAFAAQQAMDLADGIRPDPEHDDASIADPPIQLQDRLQIRSQGLIRQRQQPIDIIARLDEVLGVHRQRIPRVDGPNLP